MLKKLAQSKWFDLLGVAIVVAVAISAGYATQMLDSVVDWGPWTAFVPFGLISIGNTVLSIMSTRLTGRMSNLGNVIGIINAVLSGVIDYLLGNQAAIITYPVTFIIYVFAIRTWQRSERYKAAKPLTGAKGILAIVAIFSLAFAFSFATNYVGYQGRLSPLFWVTTLAFALSLGANVLNAMKQTLQWHYWFVYNLVQLSKALIQGNWANVGKYIYYIINSIAALSFWSQPEPADDPAPAQA